MFQICVCVCVGGGDDKQESIFESSEILFCSNSQIHICTMELWDKPGSILEQTKILCWSKLEFHFTQIISRGDWNRYL